MSLPPDILKTIQDEIQDSPGYQANVKIADAVMESALEYGKREGFLLKEFEITENLREKIRNIIVANIYDGTECMKLNKPAIQMFMGYNQCLLDQQGKRNVEV